MVKKRKIQSIEETKDRFRLVLDMQTRIMHYVEEGNSSGDALCGKSTANLLPLSNGERMCEDCQTAIRNMAKVSFDTTANKWAINKTRCPHCKREIKYLMYCDGYIGKEKWRCSECHGPIYDALGDDKKFLKYVPKSKLPRL
jgi:hypothetical protein